MGSPHWCELAVGPIMLHISLDLPQVPLTRGPGMCASYIKIGPGSCRTSILPSPQETKTDMGFSSPLWGLAPVCGFQPTPDHLHLTHIFYSCLPACGLWTSAWDMKTKKVKVESLSRVQLFGTPWTVAYQVPQFIRFSRQEYWSGLPFPSPGYLPDPRIEPRSSTL